MRTLILLSLASTALSHSPLHKRHSSIKARSIEQRAGEAFNFDADAIFPPPLLEKRGLLGGLLGGVGTLLNTVLAPLIPSTSTTTAGVPVVTVSVSIPAVLPTTTAAAATTTADQGNPQTQADPSPSDTPVVPGASPTSSAGAAHTTPSNGNTPAAGSAAGSGGTSNGALAGYGYH
jgi:hypothetical protein